MKIVFTADLHLDSAFASEDSAVRNGELLAVFESVVADAVTVGADALIIGGDLFDTPTPSAITAAAVKKIISDSGIKTYAIAGNHDGLDVTDFYSDPPENMFVFGKYPESVDIGGVTLCGASVGNFTDCRNIFDGVRVDDGTILLCHGSFYEGSGHYISREAVEKTGAALCLMGHIHKTAQYNWQGVRALYCGAPAGRGFDETGELGYYLIDTDLGEFTYRKTNAKIYKEYKVDITGLDSIVAVSDKLYTVKVEKNEIARVLLTGEVTGEFYIDCDSLLEHHPFFEIKDCTVIADSIMKNENSDTLEGEFIRILKARLDGADEWERQKIYDAIKEGITLLRSGR